MIALEDYLHPLKTAYRTSPAWFKHTVGWVYSGLPRRVRYGSALGRAEAFLKESQWWSREALLDYQWRQMRDLLNHAYTNVPYYRRVWRENGISPADIRSLADVAKLPLLTKDQIREHGEELVAENYRDRLLSFNTGGSTGQPLKIYWERGRTRPLERAFLWRQWRMGGFEAGERTAVLRGQTVREGLYHYDPIDRHLFLSGFNLSESTAARYVEELRRFRPLSIQAYPSAITVLANFMKRRGDRPLEGLKVILAGSENLYPAQRELLEEVFQCRVYSWYGHAEVSCMAGGCDHSNLYHVWSEYGYTELVDPHGESVVEWRESARGEIVGTGFNGWAMPLIRYRTGDVAVVGPDRCACGRAYPLWEKIEGRRQEYVVGENGRLIPLTALIFGQHYHAFDKLSRMQIVQERPSAITVRLVATPDWTPDDERRLRDEMRAVTGAEWAIDFEYVDNLQLTAGGKHRFVVQKLPLDGLWSGAAA